jgi:formate dehydrogenase major subunit
MNTTIEEAYTYTPKLDDGVNYSWLQIFDEMYKGKFSGFFAWGQNPTCSGANANKVREGLKKLKWMVNVNIFDNETGSFWKGPGMDPKEIDTEVFMLPCAASMEKEGSITNSGRWMQWRYKATNPPGQAIPDGDIITELYYKIKELYEEEGGKLPEAITKLSWDYGLKMPNGKIKHFDTHLVAKEINGYFMKDTTVKGKLYKKGTLVPSFAYLQADGSTSSGNWLYCNSYTEKGNMAARRSKSDPSGIGLYSNWSWCWPVNRRILYNRASVDKNGAPWAPEKPVIWWTGATKWKGDVPDGGWKPLSAGSASRYPFIMKPEGHAHIFGPGRADGPFPEHYEPFECPVEKNIMSPQLVNPVIKRFDLKGIGSDMDKRATCDPRYPLVCTTYRVSEHWQTGVMTRWQPWLMELQPDMFVEMSKELAKDKGIDNGDTVKVKSARGEVVAVAIVTSRFKPLTIAGTTVHQVGIPWHYGWRFPDSQKKELRSANLLTPNIGDPNTMIPESKAFMVDVVKGGTK